MVEKVTYMMIKDVQSNPVEVLYNMGDDCRDLLECEYSNCKRGGKASYDKVRQAMLESIKTK